MYELVVGESRGCLINHCVCVLRLKDRTFNGYKNNLSLFVQEFSKVKSEVYFITL